MISLCEHLSAGSGRRQPAVAGTASDLAFSFGVTLSRYPPEAQNWCCLNGYYEDEITAKDHERIMCAGAVSKDFNLTANTPLPCREAILKNSKNKVSSPASCVDIHYGTGISAIIIIMNNMQLVNNLDCPVTHGEVDITLCSHMLDGAASSAETVMIVCDDTDVIVLLVYWTWSNTIRNKIHMEKLDGTVRDIGAKVEKLGDKCDQLLGMHALSGYDTVSYPCDKGNSPL